MAASPVPPGPSIVPPPKDGTTIPSPWPKLPTVKVPQNANRKLSQKELRMLVSRDGPLPRQELIMAASQQIMLEQAMAQAHVKAPPPEQTAAKVVAKVEEYLEQQRPSEGVTYKATVTLRKKISDQSPLKLAEQILKQQSPSDLANGGKKYLKFQLVSTKIDPTTKEAAVSEEVPIYENMSVTTRDLFVPAIFTFDLDFHVSNTFGEPGAIIVKNPYVNEFLLISISITTPDKYRGKNVFNFPVNSWVYNTDFESGRIFFSNDVYLPKDTPKGLVKLREQELQNLRGSGDGERKFQDRIYDYDVYNDLGDPDEGSERPVLGGSEELPYPRRCRTGRPLTGKDPKSERKPPILKSAPNTKEDFYIPRDEKWDDNRFTSYISKTLQMMLGVIRPVLLKDTNNYNKEFKKLDDIKALYGPKVSSSNLNSQNTSSTNPKGQATSTDPPSIPKNSNLSVQDNNGWKYFTWPKIIEVDDKAWLQDIEFGRQMVSGLNPLIIKLVKEFPIKSTLSLAEFGDPISAITIDHIQAGLGEVKVEQALKRKLLFVQDYHDIFLPYVGRVNALGTAAIYAPRTLLFRNNDNTLTPLAIELVLPPESAGGTKRSRVFTPPPKGSKEKWVWELAKAHVASVDSAYHQVISHFLRTHAVIEPFTIATNRQLSILHPINQVLIPHYKNTLDINAAARNVLINSGGIIENNFALGKFAMEMSAKVYKLDWNFNDQALPNDLIKRGMAVEASYAPHGVKLIFDDYPFALDGLELWGALKDYMTDHVKLFYKSDKDVQGDEELQKWWTEVRTKGHGDKKDNLGWPTVDTIKSLIFTLTTIAWVASGLHAAVNFGQYAYSGYMPNHPSMTRKFIPEPGSPDWESLQNDPERFYLDTISNVDQATKVMSTVEVLSSHAPGEEYLGQRLTPNWSNDPRVLEVFEKFSRKTKIIEDIINERNKNKNLKNRFGPGKVKYELLLPTSELGMTERGVPNSVSI